MTDKQQKLSDAIDLMFSIEADVQTSEEKMCCRVIIGQLRRLIKFKPVEQSAHG